MTVKTRAAFKSGYATTLADNTAGEISAADLRGELEHLADSAIFPEDNINGSDGADGRTVLNGASAPASGLGADGDFYIDTAATAIYGPKASGAWGAATSLIGADGEDAVLPANLVTSDTTEAGGGTAVGNIVQITQAAYDALDTPDADTLYVING